MLISILQNINGDCMSTTTENGMLSRIFVGYSLHPELKVQLGQSPNWKQAQIMPHDENDDLLEIHYQDKDYIGHFLSQSELTLQELKSIEQKVQERLREHCPKFPIEKLKFCVFSQVFIS